MTAPKEVRCENCLFFQPLEAAKGQGGECHFNPPTTVVVKVQANRFDQPIETPVALFTQVNSKSWCAKFSPSQPRDEIALT